MQKKRIMRSSKIAQSKAVSWLIWVILGILLGVFLLISITKVLKFGQ